MNKDTKRVINQIQDTDPRWLAECFHDFYEAYARIKGWKTQENCTNIPFDQLPKENQATMLCTASSVLRELAGKIAIENHIHPKSAGEEKENK